MAGDALKALSTGDRSGDHTVGTPAAGQDGLAQYRSAQATSDGRVTNTAVDHLPGLTIGDSSNNLLVNHVERSGASPSTAWDPYEALTTGAADQFKITQSDPSKESAVPYADQPAHRMAGLLNGATQPSTAWDPYEALTSGDQFKITNGNGDQTLTVPDEELRSSKMMLANDTTLNGSGSPTAGNDNNGFSKDAEQTAKTVGKFSDEEVKALEDMFKTKPESFNQIMQNMKDHPNDQFNIQGWKGTADDAIAANKDDAGTTPQKPETKQAYDDAHKLGFTDDQINEMIKFSSPDAFVKTMDSWRGKDPAYVQEQATQIQKMMQHFVDGDHRNQN